MKVMVRKGDTLWYFSQLFQIPLQLIIDSNPHKEPNVLAIGDEVNIPSFTLRPYTIKPGDMYWNIAQRFNLSTDALLLVNQHVNPNKLSIGQRIYIPISMSSGVIHTNTLYDYQALVRDIDKLRQVYPFIKLNEAGKSVLNSNIPELIIGRGPKKVHWNGAFHANEWITTAIIMQFLNDYLLSLTNSGYIRGILTQKLYDSVMLSVVPMVNPDGVNLVINGPPNQMPYKTKVVQINSGSMNFSDWKANIRGVDLNNQYPANWEIEKERKKPKAPAPRDYPGDAPLTEPEAIAMEKLTEIRNFDRVLAFHTQGEEIYWGYEGYEPPYSEAIVKEFVRVSGYKAVRYVDSHAGYKDWFIQEWRRSGFTIELGRGINPLPLSQFDEIYNKTVGIFLASMYM
ncbi:M14 family metallopeptidase [Cytobacillus sp. IB215665]|uniref:M14 family metallopeptidase n=1 Tax=Cytobacillus sp. IB215665 TaxID=3097357 RepID=UPI002A185F5E|nr:M14 family metallopeptidase [Cytobacillus sp. IB215665]MDX8364242.1 M14 family metallopeptidase [Cytobacillus sp. IB215665]